jgi:uncharacterized membrane protein
MIAEHATPERLGAFSDGVIAIIITIMVLDLHVPHDASPASLLALWPTFAAYSLSYLFVGVVWVNHHHLLRYTERAEPALIWANFGLLFSVSLIPFFTAYMAENRMAPFTTACYAGVFLLITIAFIFFQRSATRHLASDHKLKTMLRVANRRNLIALVTYSLAIPVSYFHSVLALALILGISLCYVIPEATRRNAG